MRLSIKIIIKSLLLLYLFIYLITLPTISFAADWYVNATVATTCKATACGSECKGSLVGAINSAADGDTIYVCSNNSGGDTNGGIVRSSDIDVTKSLNIYGNQSNTRMTSTGGTNYLIGLVSGAGTNLSNFTLVGIQSTGYSVVYIGVNNASVFENNITNSSIGTYVASVAGDRQAKIYNNRINDSNKGIFIEGNSNNVTNNTIFNNSETGIYIQNSNNSNISFNIIYNNSITSGITINGSSFGNRIFNNTIQNHSSNYGIGVHLTLVSGSNTIFNNNISVSLIGIFLNLSNFTNISGNTFNSNANSTLFVNSYNNIIISNNIYNTTSYSIYVAHGNGTNITSNFIQNATVGIYLNNASSANISHNNVTRVQRGENFGFYLLSSNNSFVWNNTAFNNTHGFAMESIANATIILNIGYNNSVFGFTFGVIANNNNITDNRAYNNSDSGFAFDTNSNNSFSSNFAYNNSVSGFAFNAVTGFNLSQNNATNNLGSQYQFESGSNVTFTGPNRAFQTPSGALDLNISGSSNVTTLVGSTYNNFTSENLTIFFHNAFNVSIKFLTNNSAGAAKSLCSPSSVSLDTLSKDCVLVSFGNGFNTVVNITNTSSSISKISLGIYFNTTDGVDSTDASVQIARYSSGWLEVGRTVYDGTAGSVRYDDITSFSLFGAVRFRENKASDPPSTTKKSLIMESNELICPGNLLELIVKDTNSNLISDIAVRLILYEPYEGFKREGLTNADGKAIFDLTNEKDGKYQLDSSKTGYQKPADVFFDFVHCAAGQSPVTESPSPAPPPDEPNQIAEYELITQEKLQTGDELLIKATKDGLPCAFCTIIMRYPSEEKLTIITNQNGEFKVPLLFSGNYVLSLLDEEEHITKEKTVVAESSSVAPTPPRIAPSEPKLEEKPQGEKPPSPSGLDAGQISMVGVAILIVLLAVYYFMSKKKR